VKAATQRRLSPFMAALLLGMLALPSAPIAVRAADPCGDVQLIWARGSGEVFGSTTSSGFQFSSDLTSRLPAGLVFSFHELGGAGSGGFSYPAAGDIATLADGLFPIIPGSPYGDSVAQGRGEFDSYVAARAAACPNEVFVTGGWSQGAQVIGSSLADLTSQVRGRIAYVALFGDPTLLTGNSIGPFGFPVACAIGQRPWIRGSAPCWTSGGIFGPRDPYVPADIELRVGSWCELFDGVCEGSLVDLATALLDPFKEHFRYFDADSDSAFAAREAAVSLQIFIPARAPDFDVSWNQFVFGAKGADLAIVFDTTGSMSGAIADAKTQATQVAQRWLSFFKHGRVGLVEFKDQGDPFVARVDLGLTSDAAAFQTAVNGLTASGGGDTPEAQLSGVMTALDGMAWASGATKVTIVITDAPGKDPEPVTGYTRTSVSNHALQIDPVALYGVNVSGDSDATAFMQPLAAATAGQVFVLSGSQTLSDALFAVLDAAHASPVAKLRGPYIAQTGSAIQFDAGDSFDASAAITAYDWDFNGDGTIDRSTTVAKTTYTYPSAYHGQATVRVTGADGRSSIATTAVTVDSVGLANSLPIAPPTVTATVTGSSQVTISWSAAANDRADGYKVFLANGSLQGYTFAGHPLSLVVNGLDLSQPLTFQVRAVNGYGASAATSASPVGGSTAWSGILRVNDDATTQAQVSPDVALSPNGAAIAVWQDYRTSPDIDIYASRWDPSTQTWAANARVNDVATGQQYKPSVAIDANNNAYAAWVDLRNGRSDIYFSKRSATTGVWGANVRVNSVTNFNSQDQPNIAVSPSGDAIALWTRTANNKLNVWSARLPAGSSTWGPEIRVTTNQTTQKQSPKVAFGPNGTAYAVWMDPNVGDADIWYATLPAGSSTWSTNTKISDDPGTAFQGTADIGVDGAGNVMVAWTDRRATPYQLRVRRLPAGGTWGPSTVIAADGGNSPSIAVRTDGRAYLAWHDGDFSTAYPKLWGSTFSQSTGTWSAAERIDMNGSDHGAATPAVAINSTRVFVLWKNALSVPSGANNDDILARWRTP
jgi:hypothetical protein